jgi:Ftsk gamma domain/HNH endonuclease
VLQRRLRISYARAAGLIDQLEELGYVGTFDGSNARLVLRQADAPEPEPPDRSLIVQHQTLANARSVLGMETPPLTDIDPDARYDLYDFECTACGRLESVFVACDAVLDTTKSALGDDAWFAIMALAFAGRLRPAMLQKDDGMSFEQASDLLVAATNLGLLRRTGNSWSISPPPCSVCMTATRQRPEPRRPDREPIPAQLRFRVLQRDGFRCVYCGQSAQDGAVLHVDHVVPVAAGGETTEDNLVSACSTCNLGKSASQVIDP